MNASWRWAVWMPLLAGAAWLALGDEPATAAAKPEVALPTALARAPAARPDPGHAWIVLVPREQLMGPTKNREGAARNDPFFARSWKAPLVATPTPPPTPLAPPLPYAFLGKKLESGHWEVFLTRGEQSFLAKEGQTLEGSYRVDKVQPPWLTLTYLPLGQAQTLAIGDVQ